MSLRWRTSYFFLLPTGLGLALLWAAIIVFCRFDRAATLGMVRRDSGYLSVVFARDSTYTFQTADRGLLTLRDDLGRNPHLDLAAEAARIGLLSDTVAEVLVFDQTGRMLGNSHNLAKPVDISDRSYFKTLAVSPRDIPIIFGPINGRLLNQWAILLARRISRKDGSFAGIVVASLDPFHLARFYEGLNIGPGISARLITLNGDLLAETNLSRETLAQHLRLPSLAAIAQTGDSVFAPSLDPITSAHKLFTVRRLDAYPQLAVVIGFDSHTVLAPVRFRRNILDLAGLLLTVIVIVLAQRLRSANRNLYLLATIDELTGFSNRRHFLTHLETEVRRSTRYPQPLTLAIFDLDRFKSVNDTYGHAAGDAVLRAMADCLRATFRETDLAGRLGGEEFAILMPATAQDGAVAVCERLRLTVARTAVPAGDATVQATISIGIAAQRPEEDGTSLLVRADRALYQAKRNGRNRIEIAE
jgi:diguanylate cyclase (GGDEF)-like protein